MLVDAALAVAPAAQERLDVFLASRDHPAIRYSEARGTDRVAALAARLQRGDVTLAFDPANGYLRSILGALGVPAQSQSLVFSDDPATSNCAAAYPPGVRRLHADPETIISLAPDLVCVAGYTTTDALRLIIGAGLPVVRWSRFDAFADVLAEIRLLGAAVGEEARAEALAGGVETLLADLERRLAGVRRVRVLYYDPPTFTMGRGTLLGEILNRAGGANVVDELGIVGPGQIGIETVLALEPEAIITPNYAGNTPALRALDRDAIWRQVPAVRAGRVHEIPGAWISTVSHHAAQGLSRVARVLHPEAFPS